MATSSNGNGKRYFNLHITGLGYLNRIREIKPRKGDPFLACDIAAILGPNDDVEYCRFDVKVAGSDAQHLVRKCIKPVTAERKVLIGFRLGDLWVDQFTYSKGERAGQPGVSLKARLLFISWIKVDQQLVYKAESRTPDDTVIDEPPESEPAIAEATTSPPPASETTTTEAAASF